MSSTLLALHSSNEQAVLLKLVSRVFYKLDSVIFRQKNIVCSFSFLLFIQLANERYAR